MKKFSPYRSLIAPSLFLALAACGGAGTASPDGTVESPTPTHRAQTSSDQTAPDQTAHDDLAKLPPLQFIADTPTPELQVAFGGDGNGIVVWSAWMPSSDNSSIRASRYSAASRTWGAVEERVPADGFNGVPRAVIDRHGNITVVWPRPGPPSNDVLSRRFDKVTQQWHEAQNIGTGSSGSVSMGEVRLAADAAGSLTAIWR